MTVTDVPLRCRMSTVWEVGIEGQVVYCNFLYFLFGFAININCSKKKKLFLKK